MEDCRAPAAALTAPYWAAPKFPEEPAMAVEQLREGYRKREVAIRDWLPAWAWREWRQGCQNPCWRRHLTPPVLDWYCVAGQQEAAMVPAAGKVSAAWDWLRPVANQKQQTRYRTHHHILLCWNSNNASLPAAGADYCLTT